jgi:hypothetical protein
MSWEGKPRCGQSIDRVRKTQVTHGDNRGKTLRAADRTSVVNVAPRSVRPRPGAVRNLPVDSRLFLLGASAAKADYEAGCQPDVVLVSAEERCAVVVGVKNADDKVRSQVKVDATAGLHRKSQVCVGQSTWAAKGIVDVRAANQEFSERAGAPLIAFAVETRPPKWFP